jgi:hypothetical protein
MNAYVYLITFLPTGQLYIGSRKSKNPSDDLFKQYFTSSKVIKSLLDTHGIESFKYEVLNEFESYKDAVEFERSLHIKNDVVNDPNFLNRSIAGERFFTRGPRSEETKEKIRKKLTGRPNPRKGLKGKPCSEEKKKKLSLANIGKFSSTGRSPTDVWHKKLSSEPALTWYNKNTGETFFGNRRELKMHDNTLYVPELGWVITAKSKSHKGWTII